MRAIPLGACLCAAMACTDQVVAPAAPPVPPVVASTPFGQLLDSLRTAHDLPALGAAVVTADSILHLDAVGFRVMGAPARVTPDDRFHLGSVLKHQVAVLAARLVERGTLSWTRTLDSYLPDEAAFMRPEYRPATLADLLSHSAGLDRDPVSPPTSGDPRSARRSVTSAVLRLAPVATPGTYRYSNSGYIVAGTVLERVTNRTFEQLMEQELWAPLGVTAAGWGPAGTGTDQPAGHVRDANGVRRVVLPGDPFSDNPPLYGPAGRAHMSVRDWARFTQALLRAESGRDTPVLSAAGWRALTRGHVATGSGSDGYGFGLGVTSRTWAGGRTLSHDGTNLKHYAVTWIAPERGVAFLVATNQWDAGVASRVDQVVGRLVALWQRGR